MKQKYKNTDKTIFHYSILYILLIIICGIGLFFRLHFPEKQTKQIELVEQHIAINQSIDAKGTPVYYKKEKSNEFKVVVYYPSWKLNDLDKVQYDIVTHIIYAFAIPKTNGTLKPLENETLVNQLVEEAHKHNRKVMLAVGGWSDQEVILQDVFKQATETKAKLKKFADSIVAICEKYNFDGIDMDWEHPRVDDNSGKQYETLMQLLSKKLHKKGKLLTSAVISGVTPDGTIYYDAAAHSDNVINAVDWFHIMAYDGEEGERHSTYSFAVKCANYWKNTRNMPATKVVLGVPFYGRPSGVSYQELLEVNSNAYKTDYSSINGITTYYNGIATIRKKTRYAKDNLGGIMVWEITQDTSNKKKSLLGAIGKELNR